MKLLDPELNKIKLHKSGTTRIDKFYKLKETMRRTGQISLGFFSTTIHTKVLPVYKYR